MNQQDDIVKSLELLLKTGVIDGSNPFIDIEISGYCINTFDNMIYPDFLFLYCSELSETHSLNSNWSIILSDQIQKYCSNFFGEIFAVYPANISYKKITSPISRGGNQVT